MSDRNERIKQRAYQIWEEQGRPEGKEHEHWQQASDEFNANSVEDPMGDELSLIPGVGEENLSVLGTEDGNGGSQAGGQSTLQTGPGPEAPQSGVEQGSSSTPAKAGRGKKRS